MPTTASGSLVAPEELPVETSWDRGSRYGMTYAERSGTVSGSPSFAGVPYFYRGGNVQADVENGDPDTIPVSPPVKWYL